MPDASWYLDPQDCDSLAQMDTGILCSPNSIGRYADLQQQDELETLEFLRVHPWREGLAQRLADRPWLRDIIIDPRRPAAVLGIGLTPGLRVLDVGSGWGQLSIPLAKLGHRVCSLDQTPSRLRLMMAIARQESVSLAPICGDIETFPVRKQGFDLVILNGVLEWTVRDRTAASTSAADHQVAVLQRCRSLLAPGGRIFLAIENALGLKYLMGSREDHAGVPWAGLADDHQSEQIWRRAGADCMRARTHDLAGYRSIIAKAGLIEGAAWGCFPDYKLPNHVVPLAGIDKFLLGEPDWMEHHGDNGAPLPTDWPWREAYRRFARLGCGWAVAPSYAFVLTANALAPGATIGDRP